MRSIRRGAGPPSAPLPPAWVPLNKKEVGALFGYHS
jgi:hypothetical protein